MIMTRIDWTDEFKVGVPAIDSEHRELLKITNDFLSAVQSRAPVMQLAEVMGHLIGRTRAHFRSEETLLDRHNYPGLVSHRAEHDRLITHAERLHSQFSDVQHEDDAQRVTLEAASFLQHWLLDHILRDDKPYRPFLMSLA